MVRPLLENVKNLPRHKKGSIRHKAICDRRSPRDNIEKQTGLARDQQTAGEATLDQDPYLGQLAGSHQETTKHCPRTMTVACQMHHREDQAAELTRDDSGCPLGTGPYGRQGKLEGRRSTQGRSGKSKHDVMPREGCVTHPYSAHDLGEKVEKGQALVQNGKGQTPPATAN